VRTRARRGISLFEAVVAVTIVGITAVSALSASAAEMRTAAKARRAIELEALATQRLDFMELLTDRELTSLSDSVASGTFAEPFDHYSWKTTSAPLAEQAGIYNVRTTITWEDGSYTVRTYLYRRPPVATRRAR
jgi:type II secretory pathway pseudopilin PulG